MKCRDMERVEFYISAFILPILMFEKLALTLSLHYLARLSIGRYFNVYSGGKLIEGGCGYVAAREVEARGEERSREGGR